MQRAHDREDAEHLRGGVRSLTPVLAVKRDLRNLLSRAKAVVDGTATESLLSELRVNAAAVVRLQIGTRLPSTLVDREIRRDGEGRRDTAQREAARAVGPQVAPVEASGQW